MWFYSYHSCEANLYMAAEYVVEVNGIRMLKSKSYNRLKRLEGQEGWCVGGNGATVLSTVTRERSSLVTGSRL